MKRFSFLAVLLALMFAACASSNGATAVPVKQAEVKQAGDTMVSIPYRKDRDGTTWEYEIFQPAVPADVPRDIYAKLWNINLKTIKAGKYDYNAFNFIVDQVK